MNIDIYKRSQIEQVTPDPNKCLISITTPVIGSPIFDPHYKNDVPIDGWHECLFLEFHDATQHHGSDIVLFNEFMAAGTVDFILRNKDNDLVIHCDAGQSRSVAIGKFATEIFDDAFVMLHAASSMDKYNRLIIEQLYKYYNKSSGDYYVY